MPELEEKNSLSIQYEYKIGSSSAIVYEEREGRKAPGYMSLVLTGYYSVNIRIFWGKGGLTSSEEWMVEWIGGAGRREQEKGKEGELGLVCKI